MIDKINNQTNLLEKSLDATWLRNEVISNNIANVNTPGFKKSVVSFEDMLSSTEFNLSMTSVKGNSKFLPLGNSRNHFIQPSVRQVNSTSVREDGNNVDIDVEMAELAKNTIKYNALVNQLSKQYSIIKLAINEGRK